MTSDACKSWVCRSKRAQKLAHLFMEEKPPYMNNRGFISFMQTDALTEMFSQFLMFSNFSTHHHYVRKAKPVTLGPCDLAGTATPHRRILERHD